MKKCSIVVLQTCIVLLFSGCLERVPPGTGVLQVLTEERHSRTTWSVEPSYPHDALAFLNLITLDPYFSRFYPENPGAPWREKMSEREKRGVDSLKFWVRDRFGGTLSSIFTSFFQYTGAKDLKDFQEMLREPEVLQEKLRKELDSWSLAALGGWRVPGGLFRDICAHLRVYLEFLERSGFEEAWNRDRMPTLETAAAEYRRRLVGYNLVPAVEAVLGGGLSTETVTVLLGSFVRPNGIALGRNTFLMEDRTDVVNLVAVAAHELIHGHVDWSGPELKKIPEMLARDPLAVRRFGERDSGLNYNTWPVMAEESWTKALDQLVQEELFPALAPDPRERFWNHDSGLHTAALLFYRMLKTRNKEDGRSAVQWLVSEVASGRIEENAISELWHRELGLDRPGRLPDQPRVRRIYLAGDPELDRIHDSYNRVMKPGQAVVFLEDWFTFDGPAVQSLMVLDDLGRHWTGRELKDPVTGLKVSGHHLFSGNGTTTRDGKTFYFRNTLYMEISNP